MDARASASRLLGVGVSFVPVCTGEDARLIFLTVRLASAAARHHHRRLRRRH
jgi:hypothetical protein